MSHTHFVRSTGIALAAIAAVSGLAGCQKTTTTTDTPGGATTTTTTYSTPSMPALGASAAIAASQAMAGASQAVAGASQALGEASEKLGDAAVTAKVKTALLTAADIKAMQIDVDTKDGVVSLKGSQETQAAADRAVSVARGTDGVKAVESQIAVKPR